MSSSKSTKLAAKALSSNPYVKPAPLKAPKAKKEPTVAAAVDKSKSQSKRGPSQDALRAEVLALGGDEAEFNMLADVDSDSEVEGEQAPAPKAGKKGKGSDEIDPALSKELRSLFKDLNFPSGAAALEAQESEAEEDDDEESSEDDEESEASGAEAVAVAVAAPAVAAPAKVAAAKPEKKESKHEREEKRRIEREAEKERLAIEKAAAREVKAVVKPVVVKSPWVVDPTPQWYSTPLPELATAARPAASTIANLQTRATTLLERENTIYASSLAPRAPSSAPPPPNGLSKADQVFIQQILTSGTSSDKVSALLLLVSSAPLHTKAYLEQLVALCKKKSRDESGRAVRGVVDWWRGGGGDGGGSPSRKLRAFADQPGLGSLAAAWEILEGGSKKKADAAISRQEAERCLVIWAFEDWLKKWFFNVLMALEQMSVDPLPHPRTLAVVHLSNLLRDKPEQEGNILRLLVNKLGDSQRGIASKTSHHLLQILQFHPGMTPILVREVSSLILRPAAAPGAHVRFGDKDKPKAKDNGQDHARYYGVITLNQVMLTKHQAEVAGKMIEVYFEIFGDILGRVAEEDKAAEDGDAAAPVKTGGEKRKRGGALVSAKKGAKADESKAEGEVSEMDSKLVAAVLTGVNRAFPFAQLDEDAFKARLDTLFRITHTGTFNVSIQALMLIYHVSAAKRAVSDRFYRALYSSLYDPRLAGSNKQALYLNLVLKAMKQDRNTPRVAALIKRLVQVMLGMDVTFILGSIWIVGELMATVPGLRNMLSEPESPERSARRAIAAPDAAAASAEAAPSSSRHDETMYDGKKREPQFANAQNSCLWEIAPLLVHFHPSVALHAEQLLSGLPISASDDLEQHSLNHFLDRFVYRDVKKNAPVKGSSMMQSGVSGQDRSGRIVMKKGPARGEDSVVNSDIFRNKDASQIPVDQRFFHQYFSTKSAQSDGKAKASLKRKSKGKGDDSDDDSIADPGFSDAEEEMPEMAEAESDDDAAEDEIWQAMKASMPKKKGDDAASDDDPDLDGSDEDMAEYDYSDSDADSDAEAEGEGAAGSFKSVFADEDQFDDADGDDDNLVEDEGDLFGSDEDMPLFGSDVEAEESHAASSKSKDRKKKKQKLKHLPMFATADDYAHLLGGSDDDEE